MPITISLSEGVRKIDPEVVQDVLTDISRVLNDSFGFTPGWVRVWKNDTAASLGGELVEERQIRQDQSSDFLKDVVSPLLSAKIVQLGGHIEKPVSSKVQIEFNIWTSLRKVYSDVMIDTDPSERETIVDVLWGEGGQELAIDFVRRMAEIRTVVDGKRRKTITEMVISPEVNDTDHFQVKGYLGFYSSKAKPYILLKKMIISKTKDAEGGKQVASKLRLFNLDRFSKRVYNLGIVRKKFEVIDRSVSQLPIGSIFFMARNQESFSSFAEEVTQHIVMPSLEPLDDEETIIGRIEQNLYREGVNPFKDE